MDLDQAISAGIERYMCKPECPCNPKGLSNLEYWPEVQQKEMKNSDIYHFNGEINNYYECYKSLQANDPIIEARYIMSQRQINLVHYLEDSLQCSGICETPRFWFFLDFFNGPPKQNCLSSLKHELNKADGLLGWCFVAMSLVFLL